MKSFSALPAALEELFLYQLRSSAPLAPEVMRSCYRLAHPAHLELLTLLAGRKDTPSDVLDSLRQVKAPSVRIAYLCRRDLPAELLLEEIKKEKRSTVLAAVASHTSLSKDCLQAISATFVVRPTRALAEVLIRRSPDELGRAVAYETLLPLYSALPYMTQNDCEVAARALASSPYGSRLAFISAKTRLAEQFYSATGLSMEARLALLAPYTTVMDQQLSQDLSTRYSATRAIHSLFTALQSMLQAPDLQEDLLDYLRTLSQHATLSSDHKKDFAVLLAPPQEEDSWEMARTAPQTEIPALILMAIQSESPVLTLELLHNPLLTTENIQTLLQNLEDPADLTSHLPDLSETVADVAYLLYPTECASLRFAHYQDPDAAKLRLIRSLNEAEASAVEYTAILACDLSDEALLLLPWALFSQSLYSRAGEQVSQAAARLSHVQAGLLGDSPAAWEVFATLSATFSGTVGDLLNMVASLNV